MHNLAKVPERTRPDPDALLAQMGKHEKGRLKVFLGRAAGLRDYGNGWHG